MKRVTPKEVSELLERGECELVDVREGVEWAGSRIPGARHIPLGQLEARHAELPGGVPVVVVCRTGRRSRQGAELLRGRGHAEVHELEGGLQAWEAAGLPTERDEKAPWPLERQVRLAAGLLVLLGLALALVWPWAIVLSWFVGGGLVFAGLTDWCGMGMLLAKAPWNRVRSGASGGGSPGRTAKA
jgi:rhodanese-related sulfurtransferase